MGDGLHDDRIAGSALDEVLGFLWTVQLLIFKGKDGRSDGPNTAQEDQVTTLLL
jgi:hypothetical protein